MKNLFSIDTDTDTGLRTPLRPGHHSAISNIRLACLIAIIGIATPTFISAGPAPGSGGSASKRSETVAREKTLQTAVRDSLAAFEASGVQLSWFRMGGPSGRLEMGFRNKDMKQVPNRETLFWSGDLIYPLISYGILANRKRFGLKLHEPIENAIAGLEIKNSYGKDAPITLRSLLSMSGGLQAARHIVYRAGRPIPSKEEYLRQNLRITYKPGTAQASAPAGYAFAVHLLEQRSGKTLQHIIQKSILNRFYMKRSGLHLSDFKTTEQQNIARGVLIEGQYRFNTDYAEKMVPRAYGLYTTAEDYSRFLRHVARGGDAATRLLRKTMFSYDAELGGSGPGFRIIKLDDPANAKGKTSDSGKLLIAESSAGGYAGIAFVLPGIGGGTVLSNLENAYFVREVMNLILRKKFQDAISDRFLFSARRPKRRKKRIVEPLKRKPGPKRDMAHLKNKFDELTGFYRPAVVLPPSRRIFSFLNDSRIAITSKNGVEFSGIFQQDAAIELIPLSRDLFVAKGNARMYGWHVRIRRDSSGGVIGFDSDGMRFNRVPLYLSVWALTMMMGMAVIMPFGITILYLSRRV